MTNLHKKLHQFTEILWTIATRDAFDMALRGILSEKAKELNSKLALSRQYEINQILDLDTSEPECKPMCYIGCPHNPEKPKEPERNGADLKVSGCLGKPKEQSMKWCKHITWFKAPMNENGFSREGWAICSMSVLFLGESYMFCERCGIPRPKPRSLAEKFEFIIANNKKLKPNVLAHELESAATTHFEGLGK